MRSLRKYIVFIAVMAAMSAVWIGTASASSGNDKCGSTSHQSNSYDSGHEGDGCNKPHKPKCERPHKGSHTTSSRENDKCERPHKPKPPHKDDGDCDHDDAPCIVAPPVVTPPPPPAVITVPGPTVTVTAPGPTVTVTVPGPTIVKWVKSFTVITKKCTCPHGKKIVRWKKGKRVLVSKKVVGNTTVLRYRQTWTCVLKQKKHIIVPVTG